jgi:hypothetical protein
MKHLGWVLTLAALAGCATHQAPKPSVPKPVSTDWSSVRSISKKTDVDVQVTGHAVVRGRIRNVTDTTLTIRDDCGTNVIPRASVEAVTARVWKQTPDNPWIAVPVTGAVLGGMGGMIASAVDKNKPMARTWFAIFDAGMYAGLLWGLTHPPTGTYESRPVYVRP